jgi:hypothetical protein
MDEINVLALVKGQERYIFLYDDQSLEILKQFLGKFASDSELSFNWKDAEALDNKASVANITATLRR